MRGIERREKCYVEVVARHTVEGSVVPIEIVWEDGRRFEIDRVVESRRAASMRVGGHGVRYTIWIGGRERFLWRDERGWYVERIVPAVEVALVDPSASAAASCEEASVGGEDCCVTSFEPLPPDEFDEVVERLSCMQVQ